MKLRINANITPFLVPNVVSIDMGDSGPWKTAEIAPFTTIFSYFAAIGKIIQSQKKDDGFLVDYVMPASSNVMVNTLRKGTEEKALYEYYYFGHGSDGSINGGLISQKYTNYGLAGMYLFACESLMRKDTVYNDGSMKGVILPSPDTLWRLNVAPTGTLGGFEVSVTAGTFGNLTALTGTPNFGDAYITRPGL